MIPDYCVRDSAMPDTGATATTLLILAIALIAAGVIAFAVRRRRAGGLAAVLALALLPLGALAQTQPASALDTSCPDGYHYDASKDTRDRGAAPTTPAPTAAPTTPAPSPTSPSPEPSPTAEPVSCERTEQPDESGLQPNTTFTMNMDGSTGKTASGEDIVNWDVAKKTIRAYMNADEDGIANKSESPYISELTALTAQTAPRIAQSCSAAVDAGKKPAAVFDADDTTLWTYDMEDAFMHFAFTPQKQQEWFDNNQMPATPGMVDLVKEVSDAGCEIIGLTGRKDSQKDYTLKNLADAGYTAADGQPLFTEDVYFTKYDDFAAKPDYLDSFCDADTCSTVQYKAGTREHIQEDLGYTIVGNFGDQWSDLMGGRAEAWIKLPNNTYYLPSPNLPDWEAKDRAAGMDPQVKTFDQLLSRRNYGFRSKSCPVDRPNT